MKDQNLNFHDVAVIVIREPNVLLKHNTVTFVLTFSEVWV